MIKVHTKIYHRLRDKKRDSVSGQAYCRRYLADMYVDGMHVDDMRFGPMEAYEVGEYYARQRRKHDQTRESRKKCGRTPRLKHKVRLRLRQML